MQLALPRHLQKENAKQRYQTRYQVVSVPVTLYRDLKNQFVEANVGFDTICKVNCQLISNICTDARSAEKVILSEEVPSSKLTLFDLTQRICDAVQARAEQDKYHGVILLPEGLIESTPEVYSLLQLLSPESDDSAQSSQIETEKLLAQLVETEMVTQTKNGAYKGKKFTSICHFFGYQARGSLPSKFDCDYAYAMMTVKRLSHGPVVSLIGKPSIHSAAVDLKGKPYK